VTEQLDFEHYCVAERFLENVWWLIYLRWLVGAVLILLGLLGFWMPATVTHPFLILTAGGMLMAANVLAVYAIRKARANAEIILGSARVRREIPAQILFDMACVTFAGLWAGGPANPLFSSFLLYILLAGILLSRTAALYAALLGTVLLVILIKIIPEIASRACVTDGYYISWYPGSFAINLNMIMLVAGFLIAAFLSGRIGRLLAFRESTLTQVSQVLADKSAELDHANARLVELDRLRVEQVRQVSHELRSPLATVRNCLMRADELAPTAAAEAGDMVKRALRRTQALMDFINDVLALARVESGRFEHQESEPVNLGEVLEQTGDSLRGRAADKGIALNLDIRQPIPLVNAAPQYMEQLVTNLLTNAVKYTPEKGRVEASVRAESSQIVLEIADTGIGMSAEQCRHLYEQFFRTPEARRMDPTGTGLGLALVKQIVDRYKGTIRVESQPGQGARFIVCLPLETDCNVERKGVAHGEENYSVGG